MTPKEIALLSAARAHARNGTGKVIRKAANLSLAEVAAAVGKSEPTVWRWEEGLARPRASKEAIAWAALLAELSGTKPARVRERS